MGKFSGKTTIKTSICAKFTTHRCKIATNLTAEAIWSLCELMHPRWPNLGMGKAVGAHPQTVKRLKLVGEGSADLMERMVEVGRKRAADILAQCDTIQIEVERKRRAPKWSITHWVQRRKEQAESLKQI